MTEAATAEMPPKVRPTPAALLGVLGIVYGDIGTSPLYAFKTSLLVFGDVKSEREIMGVLSLIFWSLILVVTVKYVMLILKADNRGEGGILALMALAQRVAVGTSLRSTISLIGVIGACLFFGDGIITPAISVLSAVEGLEIVSHEFKPFVLPIAAIVIVLLFMMQWHGTGRVGRVFGPVMALWFVALGVLGLIEIIHHPFILVAVSPTYAIALIVHHGWLAFFLFGSIVLCVTGAEALYADMGHFGSPAIRMAWLYGVLPCLVLNYFGQGALLIAEPAAASNPFFLMGPSWATLPMVLLATAATVIASQAMISGAYSIARQCLQLGFLPRLTVRHTSNSEEGQIYLPQVNAAMLVGVLILVFAFRTSDGLAAAYGIAVTGTFLCTSMLAMIVFRRQYQWSRAATIAVFGFFFIVDGLFFASNLTKVPEGGWVPLAFALALMAMMTSWKRGRDLMLAKWKQDSMPIAPFLARLPQSRTVRVPGMAIFLTGNPDYVPTSLLHNLKHNKVLHEKVLFMTVQNEDVPEISAARRMIVSQLAPGIHRVILRYGFMESPNIPAALEQLDPSVGYDPMQSSYFLSREVIVPSMAPKLSWWRRQVFLVMARNAVPATEFFRIPSDRVVELGVRVAI